MVCQSFWSAQFEKTSIKTSFVEINKSKWSIALHHDPFNTRTLFSYQIFHKGNCKATPNWKLFGISNLTLSPFISFPHIGSYVYNECVDEQGSSSRLCDIPRNYYEEKFKDTLHLLVCNQTLDAPQSQIMQDFVYHYTYFDQVPWIIPDASKSMMHHLYEMYVNGYKTDCVISVGEERIAVHTFVLERQSSVFQAMFEIGMKESQEHSFMIGDYDFHVVQRLVEYLYTKVFLAESWEVSLQLLILAHSFGIESLDQACAYHLLHNLSFRNVVTIWETANTLNKEFMQKPIVEFISRNLHVIIKEHGIDVILEKFGKELLLYHADQTL